MRSSFIIHSSIDKKFAEKYFCVRPLFEKATWSHAWGQWHAVNNAKPPPRALSDKEKTLLDNLSDFYQPSSTFSLCFSIRKSSCLGFLWLVSSLPASANWYNLFLYASFLMFIFLLAGFQIFCHGRRIMEGLLGELKYHFKTR